MNLARVHLTPRQFSAIPDEERAFLVLAGHILNEVNALNRLLYCSSRQEPGPRWAIHSSNCQSFLFTRTLVGKLNEAWNAIQDGYFRTCLSQKYDNDLTDYAATALKELKKYFGRKNLINSVRNDFAFHYSLEHARTFPADDTPTEELSLYLHKQIGNTLYQFAELVMNHALLDTLSPASPAEAMDRLLVEMSHVVAWINEFVQGAMMAVLERNVGAETLRQTQVLIDLPNVPTVKEAKIPYFVYVPDTDDTDA